MSLFSLVIPFLISGCGGSGVSGSDNTQPPPDSVHALDNWHWRNPLPQGNTLFGVTYGNGTFVAVADYGTIITSPDGVT